MGVLLLIPVALIAILRFFAPWGDKTKEPARTVHGAWHCAKRSMSH